MTKKEQLAIIEKAKNDILKWSSDKGISLYRVEFGIPLLENDLHLWVWFFYYSNRDVRSKGISKQLSQHFVQILRDLGYAPQYIEQIKFQFDSDENVLKNYEGNYFYRVRGWENAARITRQ